MSTINWSTEQTAIFDWYAQGTGNLVIEALAGTGKTSTQVEAFSYVHPDVLRILYCVFNKRNQREAAEKIADSRVEVLTLHALGFRFVKKVWANAKPDDAVEIDRVAKYIPGQDKELIGLTCKLVALAKNTYLDPSTENLCYLCDTYDIEFGATERKMSAVQSALRVLADSKVQDKAGRISFNDMVWLPCAMNWVRPTYDMVTVDEAQDMNMPQLLMARTACKVNGRVCIVGDSRQAIYGFRGAIQNGMNIMKETLQAQVLSLTTTYRCPRLVVQEAARLVPAYKAAPEAPDGVVASVGSTETAKVGDAILSRLNAPLMPLALSFLRKGTPARIEGRDIGKALVGMVRKFKAFTPEDLLAKIQAWEKKQIARLQDSKNAEKKIEVVTDTSETLQAICADCDTVQGSITKLENLFQDTDEKSKPAIVLSSVHKAKGLEWPRVFLLSGTFRASKGGEESNIYYVAITRAMRELYFVGVGQDVAQPAKAKSMPPARKSLPQTVQEPIAQPLKSGPPARKQLGYIPVENLDTMDILPGSRLRVVGEIVTQENASYVVEKVNGSGAACRNIANAGSVIHISRLTDKSSPINFQSSKPSSKGTNKQPGEKQKTKNSMNEKTIETLISKAVTAGKDDNKILMMCISNYPDVPAAEVIKLIAKGRKAASKAPAVTPPARKAAATPPARKAAAPKAASNPRPQTPSEEHPWVGYTAMQKKLIADGVDPETACKKMSKVYVKMTNGSFSSSWKQFTGNKVTVTSARPAGKEAASAPPARKAAAANPATPTKKPAKTAVAAKATPPPRLPKAAKAVAPVAPGTDGVPAQGEEVPA
jgi:hypothetical protein